MTDHIRIGVYTITQGNYDELVEKAREGMAPINRESPGFIFYSLSELGDGRFVSISTWQSREQAEAAVGKSADWVRENLADSISLQENMVGEMTTLAATDRGAV